MKNDSMNKELKKMIAKYCLNMNMNSVPSNFKIKNFTIELQSNHKHVEYGILYYLTQTDSLRQTDDLPHCWIKTF